MWESGEGITALTMLPAEHVEAWHRLALQAVGFILEEEGSSDLYLWVNPNVGTTPLSVYGNSTEEDGARTWLEDTGLAAHAGELFVSQLVARVMSDDVPDWDEVVQAVLRDLPAELVPHVDLQGASWGSEGRPGDFGGFSVRVTREELLSTSSSDFFRQLDGQDKSSTSNPESRIRGPGG